MSWTGPEEIRAQVERLWERGHLLVPPPGEPLFPLAVRFGRPDPRAMSDRFDEVRAWIRRLEEGSRERVGHGYEIRWTEVNHRQLGANRVPVGAVVPTVEDALALVGKRRAAERWRGQCEQTAAACPGLTAWLLRRPLVALAEADAWERILKVVCWFQVNPAAAIYLRQVDIPGVDTKFIEARRRLIAELLDEVLPAGAYRPELSASRYFEQRHGLLVKPLTVRFRLLDPALAGAVGGLTDVATPAAQFAGLRLPVRRVFITENEINGLAFPPMPEAMVIFGLGYGLDRLAEVRWLHDLQVHYWGDIDTHGFAMLDLLRSKLPVVHSLLMDRETLMAHREQWGQEPVQHQGVLGRLTEAERALYAELREGGQGERVRLEQERVRFSWVRAALAGVGG